MFNIFTRRFRSPMAHVDALIKRVADDVQRRGGRLGPPVAEEGMLLLDFCCKQLRSLLHDQGGDLGPTLPIDRQALTENEIATALHVYYCTCLALLERNHPSHTKRLVGGLGTCFAGTGAATMPFERAQLALSQGGATRVHHLLRESLVRILMRKQAQDPGKLATLGQRLSRLTAHLDTHLRRLFRGTEQVV